MGLKKLLNIYEPSFIYLLDGMIPALACIVVKIRGANKTEHTLRGRIYSSAARKNSGKKWWIANLFRLPFGNSDVLKL